MPCNAFDWRTAYLLFVALIALSRVATPAPLPTETIPDPLKPWVPWVLHGSEDKLCPFFYNSGERRQCSWPSRLALNITDKGGNFSQEVLAFRSLWMPLPGDQGHWPQDVKIDAKAAPVVAQGDKPGVRVAPGNHTLSGAFAWSELPESLPLPADIGLVALTLNGARVAVANLDRASRLWLKQQSAGEDGIERIELRVNRLVTDDIPLVLTTHIELIASGKSQEIVLPNVLLPGFVPLSLSSALPARFEADGKLRLQVRPGRWEVTASGRNMAPQTRLALPVSSAKLSASEEVWAFESRSELRLVTVEGVAAVDPQQTTLPQNWRRFPAFRLKPGDTIQFNQSKRGDPEPAPDKLSLARNIWLDFDGSGYTIQDRISGSITRAWRLEMAKPQTLGRVAVDGADQYITQLDANAHPGIELRRGLANISADSRVDAGVRTLAATGWLIDFNQLSAKLHLPPGWRLAHASGADQAPDSWIERWTLLDLFLVLIITLACGKLFGWRWGILALPALVLSYHESGAPTWAWLNLLAALALLRVLPHGRARRTVSVYRWLALLAVIALLVPFAVDQIRQALYPVLEQPWQTVGDQAAGYEREAQVAAGAPATGGVAPPAPATAPEAGPAAEGGPPVAADQAQTMEKQAQVPAEQKRRAARDNRYELYSSIGTKDRVAIDQIDPNAKIQTGPGLPHWRWKEYALVWSGPVEHTQSVDLWLISPAISVLLTIARLVLLTLLFARLASSAPIGFPRFSKSPANAALALMVLAVASTQTDPAHAEVMPTPDMLNQLREKLLAPADCLPHCAEISRLKLLAAPTELQLRLEAHADAATAIPLPGGAQQWSPERVLVDGAPAQGLMRDESGNLWVQLGAGVHQIAMQSALADRESVQLALPLKARRVEAELNGWTLDGLGESGEVGESLLLTRVAGDRTSAQAGAGDSLPPFVRVERTLNLGLTWQIATRVVRAGPSTAPVLVEFPLIQGESVTHSEVRVQDGSALVNLGPDSTEFLFESALKESAQLILKAPAHSNQIQIWRLNLGPQWHVALSGIPIVHHQDSASHWLPEWRPWPGEEVKLGLTKPAGVQGQTLTLDRSLLIMSPGIRATDAELALRIRSSRGGQHLVQLPDGAVLQSVAINGQTQPIRLEGRELKLPISPGQQEVNISWREPRGMAARFSTSLVNAGTHGVNGALQVKLPQGRWLLFAGGPRMGPAILFWGVVIALALIALALSKVPLTPLKWHHWFLLGLGLTQAPLVTSVIVVGWFVILGARKRFSDRYASNLWFNFGQVILVIWTLAAVAGLFWAVENGLLGYPEMQVAGNGSDLWNLRWYQDRTQPTLPTAWVVSAPLLAYRLLMLAWALWLAYALLKWLRWGWECFSDHGYWRKLELWKSSAKPTQPEGEIKPS